MTTRVNPKNSNLSPLQYTELAQLIEAVLVRHEQYENPPWELNQIYSNNIVASGSKNVNFGVPTPNAEDEFLVYGIMIKNKSRPGGAVDSYLVTLNDAISLNNIVVIEGEFQADTGTSIPVDPTEEIVVWPWPIKGLNSPYGPQWIPMGHPLRLVNKGTGELWKYLNIQQTADATVGTRTFSCTMVYASRPRISPTN